MIHNCSVLQAWVRSAKPHPDMQKHTGAQFASEYKRLAYDLAVKDAGFYSLPNEEPYRIEKIYRDFTNITDGSFPEPDDCFLRAELAAASVLHAVKDGSLSQRVALSVSTKLQKKYLRENLPRVLYIGDSQPLRERLRRRRNAMQYWLWRLSDKA